MKKALALLLSLAMVFGLAACGSSGGNESKAPSDNPPASEPADASTEPTASEPAGGDSEGKTEISVIAAQYGQNTPDWWVQFEKDFEAAHSDVDLVVECVSWNDIYTVVNTRISGQNAPDILNIDVFADYQADGLLLPAKDYVSEETYNKLYPAFLEESNVDGTIWAIPDLASARAMY